MIATTPKVPQEFAKALAKLPAGAVDGIFRGRKWGVTIQRSEDGRRTWLFAEERGGTDIVSFNLYILSDGRAALKPCEMSSNKVIEFVIGSED